MRALLTGMALVAAPQAMAQHHDHAMHGAEEETTVPTATPPAHDHHAMHGEHSEEGTDSTTVGTAPVDHGAMERPDMESDGMDHGAMDHAGHDTPGMDHSAPPGPQQSDPPEKPVDARAFSGPEHAADLAWGAEKMAAARGQMAREHGAMLVSRFSLDRLEARIADGQDGFAWEGDFRLGQDINGVVFASEGEGLLDGRVEHAEVQALWRHAINPWFDLRAGLRQDLGDESDRTYFVAGMEGLLPYWVEASAHLFVSARGDVAARVEAEHDVRITPDLILQPSGELDLALHDTAQGGAGSTVALGARLRYRVSPLFQPYLGVEWEKVLGEDAAHGAADEPEPGPLAILVGLHAMF